MFAGAMWQAILEVAFVCGALCRHHLAEAMSLILVELSFIHIAIGCRQFTCTGALASLKVTLVDGAVWEDHFAEAMLKALDVLALKAWPIQVLLNAVAVRYALQPASFVG